MKGSHGHIPVEGGHVSCVIQLSGVWEGPVRVGNTESEQLVVKGVSWEREDVKDPHTLC